ncbi:poly [ADP-ribose] polymerase 2 isoform X2 [Nerophis ophidion]|uniref:poly [ADP-ribose] polymerase 2 isoform X2 n=1 Tax=Nerophis ophidion TaxID=159077 RepID=UPI002ADF5820|nr:poly [ADP-ribose] polymerase 2 isoform X2 [Nerophis ophidion]
MTRRTRSSKSKTLLQNDEVQSQKAWQWQGDEGQWEPYSTSDCALLNSAVTSGETSISLTLGSGAVYEVDLKKMVQINPVSKYKRKIRSQPAKTGGGSDDKCDTSTPNCGPVKVKEEDEESEKRPAATGKRKRTQSKTEGKSDKRLKEETQSEEVVKTVIMKGKAPVDLECQKKLGKAHVYCEGEDVYDVMMNQTNLQFNNNKYYLIQLLEDDASKAFSVWMRWGRVGKVGQNSLTLCNGDLQKAKDIFKKKFLDKTKNEWEHRASFEKVAGKYDMVHMDYSTSSKDEKETLPVTEVPEKKTSKLDIKVQSLLELICDIKAMEEVVLEMKFDTRKAPLGKLTLEQISAGYTALKRIETCLKHKDRARELVEACNQFYTRIPHDFGLKTPPVIRTEDELKKKIELLEALRDIQIAVKMVQSSDNGDEHPLDRHYKSLNCQLNPVDPVSQEYKVIEKYLQSTHASTHADYTMSVLEIFAVDRDGETAHFTSQIHNRMLLWHGSRLTNWVGILSQGLRVAPPEAPVTGYMFGKGIYFADMSSKSANYCFARSHNQIGLLLLCEVAVGDSNEVLDANYNANNLPAGKHSTKGVGQTGPDPKNSVVLNGMTVPMGPGVKTSAVAGRGSVYSLLYNEFVVYNPAQTRMRYLLRIKFNYSSLW